MAFDAKGFRLETPGGVVTISSVNYQHTRASYITGDAAATVEAAHYFDSIYLSLPVGTTIDALMVCAGTPVRKSYVVTASASTAVTIAVQAVAAG
jgi:hypothetical protein